jgi:6-phosphogluconate dehydrogenase
MGKLIVDKLMNEGHQVIVWNRSQEKLDQLRVEKADYIVKGKFSIVRNIEEFRQTLLKPRIIWSMLPAGEATNTMLGQLIDVVESGDILIDGGNSHYKDTQVWFDKCAAKKLTFVGIGVSGGIYGLENGLSLMVGGTQGAYDYLVPILDSLAKPKGAHAYVGTGGAGHFVKMVHNGIEYGMMQAIAEGYGILAKSDYHFNLINVSDIYLQGSIISSFLVWTTREALKKDPSLSKYSGYIGSTGEGKWTLEQAKETHVPAPVLEQALLFRDRSTYDKAVQETFVAKLVQALRHEFGGHGEK